VDSPKVEAFGSLIAEKKLSSRENIPSPKISKGILQTNPKSLLTFDRQKLAKKLQTRPIPN
jgi:hypothetical protein